MRFFLLISALATFSGVALAADRVASSQGEVHGPDHHCLWRATGSAGSEVYLLGSIHALPDDAYPLAAVIDEAFASARTVFFEVDMEETSTLGSRMMVAGLLPPETRLGEVLDPETRRFIDAYLESTGLPFSAFEGMKPWMAALALTSIELMKAGFSAEAGVDFHLARRAAEDGKKIGAFETADYQIGLFSEMDDESSRAFLRYTLMDIGTVVSQLEMVTEAWKTGDVETLNTLLTEAFSEEPELFDRMVNVRNRAWMPQVEQLLSEGETAMVVVGALHLVGPGGLIEMLRDQGYQVEQL